MKKMLMLMVALCSFSGMAQGDITWSAPTTISTPLTNASEPRVVIDSANNVTAVWNENNVIMASHLPSGGSWSAPVSISNIANTASSPRLGIDSAGDVTALWIENTQITSARLPAGGSWSASTTISGTGATTPSFAVDINDNAVAVWTRGGFIEGASRVAGTWSLVSVLSAANSNNPNVYINSTGKAAAAWHTVSSGSDLIVTNILTVATNVWGTAKNVFTASAAFSHNYPKIAIDDAGNSSIAWFRYSFQGGAYQNVQLLASSLANGGASWAIATVSPDSGIRNPADLVIKLVIDSSGDAMVVWTTSYDGQTFLTQSIRKLFGNSWSTNATLLQVPSIYSFNLDVAVASGTALLTNMAWDQVSAIQILSQESDLTNPVLQGWTPNLILSSGTGNGYPRCALSINGSTLNAAAVWIHYDGANSVINASTGTESVIPPVTSVTATQNVVDYGVYQNYYNTITWDASPASDIIQYNIYRNGVYFAATDVNTLEFVDNNATQGGTVTYGVSALISTFRQSAVTTFTLNP